MKTSILKLQQIGSQWEMDSPFLFGAHHNDRYPVANEAMGPAVSLEGRNIGADFSGKDGFSMYHGQRVPGFPAHPHLGFETVTIVLEGFVDHFDSLGATGRYGNGDVQWLTTGSGCQHSEMFPLLRTEEPNATHLFQLWLNLPAASKGVAPHYKMLWNEDIPVVRQGDDAGRMTEVRIIAGSWKGIDALLPAPDSWAMDKKHGVRILLIGMDPGAECVLPAVDEKLLRNVYFYEGLGGIEIDGQELSSSTRIKLKGNADVSIRNGAERAFLLLLEGEPIQEPVVQYGPFVTNSRNELMAAVERYQKDEFGGWPWPSADVVHPRSKGRFARYADGSEEYK